MFYYKPLPKDDKPIEEALQQKAEKYSEEGFWMAYERLRKEGKPWNHKRVYRVYKNLGLSLRRKVKKRLPARVKEPLEVPETLNHTWSMDFVTDVLDNKRRFRAFTIIDDYNRSITVEDLRSMLANNDYLKQRGIEITDAGSVTDADLKSYIDNYYDYDHREIY